MRARRTRLSAARILWAARRRPGAARPPSSANATSAPKPGTARAPGPATPNAASRSAIAPKPALVMPKRIPLMRREVSYALPAAPSNSTTLSAFACSRDVPNTRSSPWYRRWLSTVRTSRESVRNSCGVPNGGLVSTAQPCAVPRRVASPHQGDSLRSALRRRRPHLLGGLLLFHSIGAQQVGRRRAYLGHHVANRHVGRVLEG